MVSTPSLIGTWVFIPNELDAQHGTRECVLHILDNRTCVYEQQTDMGLMVSWFQYWHHEEGILRYPLTNATRPMFDSAEFIPVTVSDTHLIMNGHRLDRVDGLPIPEPFDILPGTRPNDNGDPIPTKWRSKVRDYLDKPPQGEQAASSNP
jgi:hypothetical protein